MSDHKQEVTFESVCAAVESFAAERDWRRYHDPKNLSMLLGSEAGELLAEFRWVSNSESDAFAAEPAAKERIKDEIADVAISLILFCLRTGIDIPGAISAKLRKNAANYPITDAVTSPHRMKNR